MRIDKRRCKNSDVCTERDGEFHAKGNWSSRTPLRQMSPGGEGENEASLSLPCGRQKWIRHSSHLLTEVLANHFFLLSSSMAGELTSLSTLPSPSWLFWSSSLSPAKTNLCCCHLSLSNSWDLRLFSTLNNTLGVIGWGWVWTVRKMASLQWSGSKEL